MVEGGFAGGEEGVLTGVPAEEMRRTGVRGVVIAGLPDFVKEEGARLFGTAMKIELQAAIFLARWCNQRPKLGFKKQVLAFLGAHDDDQSDGVLGEFDHGGAARATAGRAFCGTPGFPLGHDGGDCTPNAGQSKGELGFREKNQADGRRDAVEGEDLGQVARGNIDTENDD